MRAFLLVLLSLITQFPGGAAEPDEIEIAQRIAEVSGFPVGSLKSEVYDPRLVGWTAGVSYTSATLAAEVLAAESRQEGEFTDTAKLLRRILMDNHQMNFAMHDFRREFLRSKKVGFGTALLTIGVGAYLSQPSYEYIGTDGWEIAIITEEEHERIQSVLEATNSRLDDNALAMQHLDALAEAAELKMAGARLLLQRELAAEWELRLFPMLKQSAAAKEADLVGIDRSYKAGRNVKRIEYGFQSKEERIEWHSLAGAIGSFALSPREPLSNVTIRVVWSNNEGGTGKWFGFFRKLSPDNPFVVPACGDFSTLVAPILLPTEMPQRHSFFSSSPTKLEIDVYADQGRQIVAEEIRSRSKKAKKPASTPAEQGKEAEERDRKNKLLAIMLATGRDFLETLPQDDSSDDLRKIRYSDPLAARQELIRQFSHTRWKGFLPQNDVAAGQLLVELWIPTFDDAHDNFKILTVLTSPTKNVRALQDVRMHNEVARECVLALSGVSPRDLLRHESRSVTSKKKSKIPARKPPVANHAKLESWIPVDGTWPGSVVGISATGTPYIILESLGSDDLRCDLEPMDDSDYQLWDSPADRAPKLTENDRQQLDRLLKERVRFIKVSIKVEQDKVAEMKKTKGYKPPFATTWDPLKFYQKQLKEVSKWSPLDFGVEILAAYCEATERIDSLRRDSRKSKDLRKAALELPVVRYAVTTSSELPDWPLQARVVVEEFDESVVAEARRVFQDGSWEKGYGASAVARQMYTELEALSDEGLLAVKMAYLKQLKK